MDFQVTRNALENVVCDALVVGAARSKKAQNSNGVVLPEMTKEVDTLLDGLISQICADCIRSGSTSTPMTKVRNETLRRSGSLLVREMALDWRRLFGEEVPWRRQQTLRVTW